MAYLTTKQRTIDALEHLKGHTFRMQAVVALVNRLPNGKPRMKGTVTTNEAERILRATGLVERVGDQYPSLWRVVE